MNRFLQEAEGNGLSVEVETSDEESLHHFATVARGEIKHQHNSPVNYDHSGTCGSTLTGWACHCPMIISLNWTICRKHKNSLFWCFFINNFKKLRQSKKLPGYYSMLSADTIYGLVLRINVLACSEQHCRRFYK